MLFKSTELPYSSLNALKQRSLRTFGGKFAHICSVRAEMDDISTRLYLNVNSAQENCLVGWSDRTRLTNHAIVNSQISKPK